MCGILAILRKNMSTPPPHFINSFSLLKSRGPDTHTIISNQDGFFAFSRLCINGVNKDGDQPFISQNGNIKVMCNGEIYNHKKLQNKYKITCKSESDCEVILHLYKKLGFKKTIQELDGVFAIVIVDDNLVHYARDQIGIRPLFSSYYHHKNETCIALSSLASPLLRLNETDHLCKEIKQVSPGIIHIFNSEDNTIFTESYINTKPPGIFCTSDTCLNVRSTLKNMKENMKENKDKWIQTKINHLLTKAVQKRLMSDKPIGCLLSGGLDSSIVASILTKLLGPKNVRTYSIGMEGSLDLKYAKIVSKHLGTKHTEIKFTPTEGINCIPEVVSCLETTDITTIRASVGMYLLAKYIKENTSDVVIMSGEGADEVMCGYLYFHYAPDDHSLEVESRRLLKELHHYDVLRADRTISQNGLELRVPFLDRDFRNFVDCLPEGTKAPRNGFEKYVLRKAFDDGSLPKEVLWRRKDGFSDGVSDMKKSWCEYIKEYTKDIKNSTEENWYKSLFKNWYNSILKNESTGDSKLYVPKKEHWMPKWIECDDPSGRSLSVYDENK